LLAHIPGATSFESLRTICIDGIDQLFGTFKEAASRRGLLLDDSEWDETMNEAASMKMPSALRELFAMLLVHENVVDAKALWERHHVPLSEDLLHARRETLGMPDLPLDQRIIDAALLHIQDLLLAQGQNLTRYGWLPEEVPVQEEDPHDGLRQSVLLRTELRYDREVLSERARNCQSMLNADQQAVFQEVTYALEHPEAPNRTFFVNSPGGCGKTFLFNLLLAHERGKGHVALAVASSGIAAVLLEGGVTAHSHFKIPINITSTSCCDISPSSDLGQLLNVCTMIVWDEAPMAHRYNFEALDRTLRDITKTNKPFGGKVFVAAGDWRQVLPVVPRGQGQCLSKRVSNGLRCGGISKSCR
jgi:hypothetical protein